MSTLQNGKVVTDNLILYLDAANNKSYSGSGTTWSDLSRSGLTASLVSGPVFNSGNGGGIVFNGSSQYANLGTLSSLVGKTNVSVECWFYNNSTTSSYQNVIGQFDGANGWLIHTSTLANYKIIVLVGDGDAFGGINDTPTGSWIQVVLAYDGTLSGNTNRLKMYINGVLRTFDNYRGGVVPATWPNSTSVNANIGALLPSYGRYFNGRISNTKIYTKTLTSQEVLQNFNAMRSRFGV